MSDPTLLRRSRSRVPRCAGAFLAALSTACVGTRDLVDPVVRIHGPGGTELGVSTTYGLVFLGRTVTSGYVDVEAHFGDGPSIEATVVEPLGAGLYTAETEIRLPAVPMKFHSPRPGDELLVAGRTEAGPWEAIARVQSDERVYGILLDVPPPIRGRPDQVGAGVFWVNPFDEHDKRLLGLVTGIVEVRGEDGATEYLAVAGPEELWRLVTHRRDLLRRKRWVYREDIL